MTIATALLVPLERRPQHGYDLKRAYDQHFGHNRPVHYGQVYAALAKLLRNGLVTVDGVDGESGPERKRYTITDAGITDLQRWLAELEKPDQYLQSNLYAATWSAALCAAGNSDSCSRSASWCPS